MTRFTRRFRILVGTAVIALTLSGLAGTASAADGPEYVGSCNMLNAMANGGLFHAWVVENANGWDGKWVAVKASGCPFEKFPQPVHE
ncbi:MAG: hypothetical protein WED12_05565 [Chloroflexota bacterium]